MRPPIALLLSALTAIGCSSANPPPIVPRWPEAAEVERITATVSCSFSGLPDITEFEIPTELIPAVLRVLNPPEYREHPPPNRLQDVGRLRIICHDGDALDVGLFFYGKGPVMFTLGGVPCIRGGPYMDLAPGFDHYLPEVLTLEGLLRAIRQGDKADAQKCLELLDKSAGRGIVQKL